MRKEVVLSLLALLISGALFFTSCAPQVATTTTSGPPKTTTSAATATTPSTTTPAAAGTPKYGGTLTYRLAADPTNFDSGTKKSGGGLVDTVYQQYMGADWRRGPAGSRVTDFASGANSIEDLAGPQIAESWQMPEVGVWKLKIREGVHWQKPDSEAGRLVNGRQLSADDIVASLNRLLTAPDSWVVTGQPIVAKTTTIEKTGPWEVTIRTPQEIITAYQWIIQGAGFNRVYPPEVVAKYGDMGNWKNAVGTGPFMLVDYVPGSSLSYIRNPNYWEKDPVGPGKGNQLAIRGLLQRIDYTGPVNNPCRTEDRQDRFPPRRRQG